MEDRNQNLCKTGLRNYLMKNAFCLPKGMLGQVGGRLMAFDKVLPSWVLSVLKVSALDSVLEIGFGPGVGIELASAIVKNEKVVGIDPSETMLRVAYKRNCNAIKTGRVELHLGTANKLPFKHATFDVTFTINSIHLWSDPVNALQEVRRTLKPQGRMAIAISRFSYASPDKFAEYLISAGFEEIQVHTHDRGTCVTGQNPK